MIIFGTNGITTTREEGDFYCPSCMAHTGYKLKRLRRFFTLYFIPVIPMDIVAEYVECAHCGESYKEDILSLPMPPTPDEALAKFRENVLRSMVVTALIDGPRPSREVVRAVRRVHFETTEEEILKEDLEHEFRQAYQANAKLPKFVSKFADDLTPQGAEEVLRSVLTVAVADGPLSDAERETVLEAGANLGMSLAHVRGVMAEFEEQTPAF